MLSFSGCYHVSLATLFPWQVTYGFQTLCYSRFQACPRSWNMISGSLSLSPARLTHISFPQFFVAALVLLFNWLVRGTTLKCIDVRIDRSAQHVPCIIRLLYGGGLMASISGAMLTTTGVDRDTSGIAIHPIENKLVVQTSMKHWNESDAWRHGPYLDGTICLMGKYFLIVV